MDTSLITMPVTFKVGDIMSEDEFFRFCQMNDTLSFERDKNGNIIFMSPTGSFTGKFNLRIANIIFNWLDRNAVAGELFDSSTGFTLPNSAVRSPDLSWVSKAKWDTLSEDEKEKFAPVCPDFIIEVRSKSDDLRYLQDKMQEYINNGCQLAWLIDRFSQQVLIYSQGNEVQTIKSLDVQLSGDPVFPGFVLDLSAIEKS
ncbi:Uma2 family endonuclease [Dyadobacter chenwenxiniae]|uniref:Uma2 family endonuclease n=1 Tax=Dyadobacter chenwenxiniae TaxID=2906456 RepID=A0A9X1PRT9_9BACT|nr:Uma2 family endonuclease [Dyadobacter chenwenxiniae]MCF0063891.1 Uma2 family endonuclease [Dyadobacter chenwenxiniae]UON82623.1 Uma2 family endonuclease [Dyadobacter chenwenxiniae]